ncbi:MAG: Adenylate kinase, partial [uncultured Nocardioidaceae bacterium]
AGAGGGRPAPPAPTPDRGRGHVGQRQVDAGQAALGAAPPALRRAGRAPPRPELAATRVLRRGGGGVHRRGRVGRRVAVRRGARPRRGPGRAPRVPALPTLPGHAPRRPSDRGAPAAAHRAVERQPGGTAARVLHRPRAHRAVGVADASPVGRAVRRDQPTRRPGRGGPAQPPPARGLARRPAHGRRAV